MLKEAALSFLFSAPPMNAIAKQPRINRKSQQRGHSEERSDEESLLC
jgi:hypothetical protein